MRKILTLILVCLACGMAMAQTFNIVERASNLNGSLRAMPPQVSYGGSSTLYTQIEFWDSGNITFFVLDENLEVKKSFTANGALEIEPYINGVFEDNAYLTISQTLFNNDEKCEYVIRKKENDKYIGFNIVSEDGNVLKEVLFGSTFKSCSCDVFLFSDKCYLVFDMETENYEDYTLVYEIERDVPSTPSVTPCDVNGDGNVTAADVTKVYDYLLNN